MTAAFLARAGAPLARAPLRGAQVEIALVRGDLTTARAAAAELTATAAAYGSSGLTGAAAQATGALLLAEGRPAEALPVLSEAGRVWRDCGARYETARVRMLARAYRALGDADSAGRELDAADAAFAGLGAVPDRAAVAALRGPDPRRPGRLTAREVEVLVCLAAGRTNREVAAALVISEKTVGRHLSNIFTPDRAAGRAGRRVGHQRRAGRPGRAHRAVRARVPRRARRRRHDRLRPGHGAFTLPAEHAACFTGPSALNLAPMARVGTVLAGHVADVARAFRDGGGVPYEAYRPEFTAVLDSMSRGLLDGELLDGIIPLVPGLWERLAAGARVADIGCGTGHAVNLLARAVPRSTVVGYDIAADAIDAAHAEAVAWGLTNASFEVLDAAALPADPPFDAVFVFDAIHDQADPAGVLAAVRRALTPDGVFAMIDVKAASRLEDNLKNPIAPWLYAVSTLHCLTVSLAYGGAGLGAAWGEELAHAMLADAGFAAVTVHDVPEDPFNSLYVARPGREPAGSVANS